MGRSHAWKIVRCLVYQGAGKIVGSTTGATPNATDTMANPIKTIEAHTPKSTSNEFWRSCIGTRRDTPGPGRRHENPGRCIHKQGLLFRGEPHSSYRVSRACQACK